MGYDSKYEEVACLIWFDKSGKMYPKMVKYQDKEQYLHTIDNIDSVMLEDGLNLATTDYKCFSADDDRKRIFHLIYFKREHIWKICWRY